MHNEAIFATDSASSPFHQPVDIQTELGAYEALWTRPGTSFKSLAHKFLKNEGARPSYFVDEEVAHDLGVKVVQKLDERTDGWYGFRLRTDLDYPERLRDATYPVEFLYFQGYWDLLSSNTVAVVGTRNPSNDGEKRTRKLVRKLVDDHWTVVSGLAMGIDTIAHETAIDCGGETIAVIGTPIGRVYPKSNDRLQNLISQEYLLISQVPVERYDMQRNPVSNRFFFSERNKTMSALTKATIIVEAGEKSGTLVQAREGLRQGRQIFILNNCFENTNLRWPTRFEKMGAVRVRDYDEIRQQLVEQASPNWFL